MEKDSCDKQNNIKKQIEEFSLENVIAWGLFQIKFLEFCNFKFINDQNNEYKIFEEYITEFGPQYNFKYNKDNKNGIFFNQSTLLLLMFFSAMWYKEKGGTTPEEVKKILQKYGYNKNKRNNFLFYMRNALAHSNIKFLNNENKDVSFWSYKNEEKTTIEKYNISFEDMKSIVNELIRQSMESFKN